MMLLWDVRRRRFVCKRRQRPSPACVVAVLCPSLCHPPRLPDNVEPWLGTDVFELANERTSGRSVYEHSQKQIITHRSQYVRIDNGSTRVTSQSFSR